MQLLYSTVLLSLSEIMFMESRIKYWADLSDYDLETANAMLVSKRYLYVGFMCHQSIEKIFKAFHVKLKDEPPPFTHSLSYLARSGAFLELLTEADKEFIDLLEPLNIEARYPSDKDRLFKSLTGERCSEILQNTRKLQQWIRQKL